MSSTAAPSPAKTARGLALGGLLALLGAAAPAGSLNYCQPGTEPGAAVQDRLFQVAAIVKQTLDDSGQRLALIARSGLALQRLDQRYSHAGISLKASPNAPWSVRQLYYACDAQRSRIFDQGMSGFVLGAQDPEQGFLSIVLLPPEAATALEQAALDERLALHILNPHYSANAYAFGLTYQNCNQWLAELLAAAWGALDEPGNARDGEAGEGQTSVVDRARNQAQQWLLREGYAPSVLKVGWYPLMWLARRLPWLHSDDHPQQDLDAAQFRVSMPQSIEAFVRARWPQAQRLEICYTAQQVVTHRGWDAMGNDCAPADGDTVVALQGS